MAISYDEEKRILNINKHGLDFINCELIFDNPTVTIEDSSYHYGEQRLKTLGVLQGQIVLLVWVEKKLPHIISLRKATKHEINTYINAVYQ